MMTTPSRNGWMPSRKNFPDVSSFFIFKVCKTPHLQIGHSFKKRFFRHQGWERRSFFLKNRSPVKPFAAPGNKGLRPPYQLAPSEARRRLSKLKYPSSLIILPPQIKSYKFLSLPFRIPVKFNSKAPATGKTPLSSSRPTDEA